MQIEEKTEYFKHDKRKHPRCITLKALKIKIPSFLELRHHPDR